MNRFKSSSRLWGAFCLWIALATAGQAHDFRVDSSVFVADQQEPVTQSVTLFHAGVVYDFIRRPAELMIYDPRAELFTLLDPQRRVRTALRKDDLAAFCQQLRRWAENQRDPAVRFSANPQFQVQFDEARGTLSASSAWLSYRVVGRVTDEHEMLRQYNQFADGSAQINALLNPGSRLPFPRLALNQHLAQRAILPEQVELTISSSGNNAPKHITLRSEHRWNRTLGEADLARIRDVRQWLVDFKPVPLSQYLKAAGHQ